MKFIKIKYLYIYYFPLQTLHLIMLIILFVNGFEKYLQYLSPNLLPAQIILLRISGVIDLFLSTPLGIIGSIRVLRSKKKKRTLSISLVFLWVSAVLYELALLLKYPKRLLSVNWLFHILFIPVVLLSLRLLGRQR